MIDKRKIEPSFVDGRGEISNLLEEPIEHVTLITSKSGAIRGNHFHREDSHYSYLLSGEFEYYQLVDGHTEKTVVKQGEMVFSATGIPHAMRFLEDSVFLALTTARRDQGRYEEDTHRYELI